MDHDLLNLIRTKANYQRFKPYIKQHVLSKEASTLLNSVDSYFAAYPAVEEIKWEAFETYFFVLKNHKLSSDQVELFKILFEKLKSSSVSPSVHAEDVLKHFITLDYSARMADTALKVADGKASIDDVGDLYSKFNKELDRAIDPTDLFVTGGVSEVLALASAPGFEWRLEELNVSCGPLRKGDFVLVAAYVETGKTTFTASEVSYMATQITDKRPVVWVNNEERSDKVLLRIQQAALGRTLPDIQKDPKAAEAEFERLMGMKNRILVLNNDSGLNSVGKLTPIIRDLNPALIVFDQLDKVAGFSNKEENEAQRLGRLYKWARELSHEYGPVMAISQTDATGETTKYITMAQLRGSKVDKPGEADAIITIGKDSDPKLPYKRYIHVPKNKLFGGPRFVEKERHGYWEVDIQPEIARYVGKL